MFLKDQIFLDCMVKFRLYNSPGDLLSPLHIFFCLTFSDKEGKIKYLEKVIDCVSFALGEPVTAKPSKIVSGQEPHKTNELLQAIAQIIDKKIGKIIIGLPIKCTIV